MINERTILKVRVLIFGIGGQDGSYLAQQLLKRDSVEVHGIVRRIENQNLTQIMQMIGKRLFIHLGDITDQYFVKYIINKIQPDFIYNLAAQSFVKASFDMPIHTQRTNYFGVQYICNTAIEYQRTNKRKIKIFQASTSQMFGQKLKQQLINQLSSMNGVSPYGISKHNAHLYCCQMRKQYSLFISTAISFNHESTRRPQNFITRKVTSHVARYSIDRQNTPPLQIGNLQAQRDWGHAQDYVQGFIKIMQLEEPSDFIISTGQSYSVRHLIQTVFSLINVKIKWQGSHLDQIGINQQNNQVIVQVKQQNFRKNEVPYLKGNCQKLFLQTNWRPTITFNQLIREMLEFDIQKLKIRLDKSKGISN